VNRRERVAPASPAPADAPLVLRALNGSKEAFGTIVGRYQQPLYRFARGMGLDHDTARDVTQDTFVRAWTRLAECRDPERLRTWLYRIARNLCIDHHRNVRQRSVPLSALDGAEQIVDPRARHGSTAGMTLREALDALPPLLREAFLLKHDAGYSYDEVAEIVDASPSAVKMRVHRAREALRDAVVG
jgi:RNA polymerase sigma-70 factor, ECF subfamily